MSSSTKPRQKDVVQQLMTFIGRETLSEKVYLKYRCPRDGCPKSAIAFPENKGWSNPYAHLKSCYARGQDSSTQESTVLQLYMNCDFILGSVAEVERIWSMAKHVLTFQRRLMSPQLFEALVFLKYNERFWNEQLVSQAIKSSRSERAKELNNAHDVYEEENAETDNLV